MGRHNRYKRDDNHSEIQNALEEIHAQVIDFSSWSGKKTFDLLVGFRGSLFILEIKNENELPKDFKKFDYGKQQTVLQKLLTKNEKNTRKFCDLSSNDFHIVYDVDSALKAIGAIE